MLAFAFCVLACQFIYFHDKNTSSHPDIKIKRKPYILAHFPTLGYDEGQIDLKFNSLFGVRVFFHNTLSN